MSGYNFRKIVTVPTSQDFVNFILSKTQRKTPTVVHKHYKISRIRKFYMRKVKYTQQNFHDRLNMILTQFPKLDDMHPFYADLLNTLYNKDHYKLSLGQLNIAMHLIDRIASDHVKLLKYADSLYRCKMLKKAALGRMVTVMKKQGPPLKYLEEVRQHMSRLPSIDPNTRTLLLCGSPNVGKSSFLNLLTNANVEVQPYAFTTKSLYVGHTDYEYLKWQVIDTPGILDRPFDEMNTIELQAITALAHLRSAVIFFLDISELCNVPIEQQIKIFENIKPLFANKPLFVACNKTDVRTLEELKELYPDKHNLISNLGNDGVNVLEVSTLTEDGIANLKKEACDKLLAHRVDMKMRTRKAESILNRIHVAVPKPRDNIERKPFIPEIVIKQKESKEEKIDKPKMRLEKDIMEELQDDYILDLNKTKDLLNEEWRYDKIPSIINGQNIADFIDPYIYKKLQMLEDEEEARIRAGVYNITPQPLTAEEANLLRMAKIIKDKLKIKRITRSLNVSNNSKAAIPRTQLRRTKKRSVSQLRKEFEGLGVDMSGTENANFTRADRSRSRNRQPIKRARMDSEGRSASRTPRDKSGVRDAAMLNKVKKIGKKAVLKITKTGRKGESDRFIPNLKPKHLFAGKRGIGKTDRR